jgi:hypothetical protein
MQVVHSKSFACHSIDHICQEEKNCRHNCQCEPGLKRDAERERHDHRQNLRQKNFDISSEDPASGFAYIFQVVVFFTIRSCLVIVASYTGTDSSILCHVLMTSVISPYQNDLGKEMRTLTSPFRTSLD